MPDAPQPVRILYVHNSADIYGASRSLLRLLPRLDRARFTPIVLLPEDGPLRARIADPGVEVVLHRGLSIITRPVFRSSSVVWSAPPTSRSGEWCRASCRIA